MIDLDRARELLTAAVATQPDGFVYNPGGDDINFMCFYRRQPEGVYGPDDPRVLTGCLIGTALGLAGIELPDDCEGKSIAGLASGHPEWEFTTEAVAYFTRAQRHQDTGKTWTQAHGEAELLAERLIRERPYRRQD